MTPPPPPTVIEFVGSATVVDGDTLRIGSTSIRLFGVDAPEAAQKCQLGGQAIACGQLSREWLRRRLRSATVRCQSNQRDQYARHVATCSMGASDIGGELVRAGWAVAFTTYSTRYVADEASARVAKRGLWSMQFQSPAAFRREVRQAKGQDHLPPDPACAIKGNINGKGDRIYHLPGTRPYPDVRVNAGGGERWFCTETEARLAGWRAPR